MMNFNRLLPELSRLTAVPLSGNQAHQQIMDLSLRKQLHKYSGFREPPKQSAVLALLFPGKSNQTQMVFILRKSYNGHHSGQISFPGGKKESFDKNLYQTALRETYEEIGVVPGEVTLIKQLSSLFIPVSNFHVSPFLAVVKKSPQLRKNPAEVAKIFSVPLYDILTNPLVEIDKNYFGKTYKLKAFQFDKFQIWGATAMILAEIVDLFIKSGIRENIDKFY
jgi:8-oxo-dGTP pyrophosphatase MutT (NUDIX family)